MVSHKMSLVVRNWSSGFPTRSYTNRAVQPQKMARGLKFQINIVEELYYPYSENKGADQLRSNAQLICVFVFAYAKSRFSHNEAQMILTLSWENLSLYQPAYSRHDNANVY